MYTNDSWEFTEPGSIFDIKDDRIVSQDTSAIKTIESILAHKKSVKEKLNYLSKELSNRAEHHDDSKLKPPEIQWLIEMDKEPKEEYGTPAYFEKQKRWEKFFKHHYTENSHHPDHYPLGISNMDLIDLCEYCCDIISYFDKMHPDDALEVIAKQVDRFGFTEQLTEILKNTLWNYFSWFGPFKPTYIYTKDSPIDESIVAEKTKEEKKD